MTARLWAPLEVADFERSAAFYGELLGLPVTDAWRRDGERGAVYAAGGGRIEIVQTAEPDRPPSLSLELPTWAAVDAVHRAAEEAALSIPEVFPRGHYGFVVADPDGNRLLLWSEAPDGKESS